MDDEEVKAQPGDFYGVRADTALELMRADVPAGQGWMTSDIDGVSEVSRKRVSIADGFRQGKRGVKGGPGTWGW